MRLALGGELVPDAVNVAGGVIDPYVRPGIPLVEKLGQIFAALSHSPLTSLDVEVHGELSGYDVSVLKLAALKGLFTNIVSESVSYVNAPLLAEQRGVDVRLIVDDESDEYRNVITLRGALSDGSQLSVSGTLTGTKQIEKLVGINGYAVELPIEQHHIVMLYTDRPGIVAIYGQKFGEAGINIAGMQIARQRGGRAGAQRADRRLARAGRAARRRALRDPGRPVPPDRDHRVLSRSVTLGGSPQRGPLVPDAPVAARVCRISASPRHRAGRRAAGSDQALRREGRGRQPAPHGAGGLVLRPRRTERRGQDHDPRDGDRAADARRGPGADRRRRHVGEPLKAKALIGNLADGVQLFDRLTGEQLVTYNGMLFGLKRDEVAARVADLLRLLDLEDAAGTLVVDYSAGMTKKIALACALVHAPRILVLDEPFESVDPVSAANIRDILTGYVQNGGTVIVSSHVMDLVQRMCDHVAVVSAGHVLAAGTIDEVRGGMSLEDRFVDLVGGRHRAEEPEWLRRS